HEHRPEDDRDADKGHQKQPNRAEEWHQLIATSQGIPFTDGNQRGNDGHRRKKMILGQLNHRCAISACDIGVQMLTPRIAARTRMRHTVPVRRPQSCKSPSVFKISHPAPNRLYPDISANPMASGNGLTQSNELPVKCRPSTLKPWIKVPRTTPCVKVARMAPPQNAPSQKRRSARCLKRNSNATPRKTSARSMIRTGK